MSTEDRKVGLSSEFDASGIKKGVQQAKDALQELPGAAKRAAEGAGAPIDLIGKKSEDAARRTESATKSLIGQIQRADTVLASGGRNTAAYFETVGKQKGIDPNILAPYIAQLRATEAAQTSVGMSAKATAAALRQVPAQFTDIVTSLAAGQQPLTVLLQQGGQLKDTFGGVGEAAKALSGYVIGLVNPFSVAALAAGVFALSAYKAATEQQALQRQAILTGDAVGYTAEQLTSARDAIASLSGASRGRSSELLGDIATSAGIGADSLERYSVAALKLERVGGAAAEKTADAFKSLAKDPLTASLKLNESMGYLTRSTYEQIKALEDQGRKTEAAKVAQDAYFDAINKQVPRLEQNLGRLDRLLLGVKDTALGVYNAMVNLWRDDTIDQKIQKLQQAMAANQRWINGGLFSGTMGDNNARLQTEIDALQKQKREEQAIAQEKAAQVKQAEAKAKWDEQSIQYLSETEQLQRTLNKLWSEGVSAVSAQTIAQDFQSIADAMLAVSERSPDGMLDRIATAPNARNEQIKRGLMEVNSLRERGALNEYEAIDRTYALEKRQLESERTAIQERLAYARQRQNSDREVSQLQAELAANGQALQTAALRHELNIGDAIYRRKTAAEEAAEAQRELNRTDADQYLQKQIDSRNRLELSQRANAESLREESELLKLQASMVGSTEAARARAIEYYRIALELKREIREIDEADTPNGEADREVLRAAAELRAQQRRILAAQRETIEEWTRGTDQIYNSLTDALLRGFEDGKGFGRNFVDTLKNLFATLVLRPVLQPIVSFAGNALASLFGIGSGGGVGGDLASVGGGGGSNLLGMASTASNIYRLLSTGIGGSIGSVVSGFGNLVGSANISAFGSGMGLTASQAQAASGAYNAAGMSNIGNSISMGSTAGAAASVLATLYAGRSLGQMIGGGYSVSGNSGNSAVNTGMAIGAFLGGPLAAAAGAVIGGVVNRAFGRKPKEVTEQGIEGLLGGGDFQGQTYANWVQKGGWFRSNKYGTDMGVVGKELDDTLDSSATTLLQNTKEWAKAIGLPAEQLDKVSIAIKTKFTGNAEEDQKAIEALLTRYQEALTGNFKSALEPFQKAGEDLTATLQRLVGLQQFSDVINDLGGIFSKVARSSVDAKEGLLALVGGADQFIQLATGFASNYYSRDEIAGGKAASLQETLKGLGITADFTGSDAKAQFRALVEGTDISSAEGQKRLATLLGIQGDFADVAGYLSETGKSLSEVANQSPGLDLLAPMMASGTAQTVQATNEVRDAIVALHETIKSSSGGTSGQSVGNGLVAGWREVTLAMAR